MTFHEHYEKRIKHLQELLTEKNKLIKKVVGRFDSLDDTPEVIEGLQENRVDSNGKYNYWVGEAQVNLMAYADIAKDLKELVND
jgi:cytochrome oxidase Cu insertion factor (SCO1/SenC/PrrC family)